MKILVLDEEFPFPLNSGKRIRSYQIWSRIAGQCDVTYLAHGSRESEPAREVRNAGMKVVGVDRPLPRQSGPGFYARLARSLVSTYPLTVDRHFNEDFLAVFRSTVASFRPDLVVCEWTPYARYTQSVSDLRVAIVAHNVEATVWDRFAGQVAAGPKRWYLRLQTVRMEQFEREAARRAQGIIAVTDEEAAMLRQWAPRAAVATIENGVDVTYFTAPPEQPASPRLVFSGAMDWRPNQHAAHYFVQRVLPLIRLRRPDVTFTIVGRNPSRDIMQLKGTPGVEVTGTVPDIRPYLGAAMVCVVPLHIGGGSRLKILEALAMSLPVVSTSVGAEGLKLIEGTHYLRADEPDDFAARVCRLLDDGDLRARMGRDGRSLVEQRYHWDGLAKQQLAFLSSLCEQT